MPVSGKTLGFLAKAFATSKAFHISFTLIFAAVLLWIPIYESFKAGNPSPFVKAVGGITLGVDAKLGEMAASVVEEKWSVAAVVTIVACLWFYYVFFRALLWFWSKMSIHGTFIEWAITLGSLAAIQITYSAITTGGFYAPLQGLWYLVAHLTYFLDPAAERLRPQLESVTNLTGNLTA